MKNIHILPTDKPSRLYSNGKYYKDANSTMAMDWYISSVGYKPQNIYITSNEELVLNGYHFNSKYGDEPQKTNQRDIDSRKYWEKEDYYITKIILTTDQDLIKDGIQEINNEFLKWFVENPSCEEVEFKKESEFYRSGPLDLLGYNIVTYKITIPEKITRCCGRCNGVDDLCYSDMTCDNHKELGYEICYGKRVQYNLIAPKENFKPIHQKIIDIVGGEDRFKEIAKIKPKQKTLKEAALEYAKNDDTKSYDFTTSTLTDAFEEGARWQQERSYSEEKVLNLLQDFANEDFINVINIKEWFEQFKKK